jgi:uncharacterized protein (DUF427 family)
MMKPQPDPVAPGHESVWDYPRPAVAEPTSAHVLVEHRGVVIAKSRACVRTLETSHPPTYYFPPDDVRPGVLRPAEGRSLCEWKGAATYWDVVLDNVALPRCAWSYPNPSAAFAILRDHIAFYPRFFDRCAVNGEAVTPQEGKFYGGWITGDLAGPFKGGPGTAGW